MFANSCMNGIKGIVSMGMGLKNRLNDAKDSGMDRASSAFDDLSDSARASARSWSRWGSKTIAQNLPKSTRPQPSISGLLLTGLAFGGIGAVTMYFFDPANGRRRRSVCRAKMGSFFRGTKAAAIDKGIYFRGRAIGYAHGARHMAEHLAGREPAVSDAKLCARIRSALGRCVSHPHSIRVASEAGNVTLSGPILASEVGPLIRCVRGVSGVKHLESRLETHESAGRIPGLQGTPAGTPSNTGSVWMQDA